MKLNSFGVTLNIGLGDKPDKIASFLSDLNKAGISVVTQRKPSRGAAQGSGNDNEPEVIGPWKQAWCKHAGVSRLRRTEGRNDEQMAYHNFMTYAEDARPTGLRKPAGA
jgi:hypothetical protein